MPGDPKECRQRAVRCLHLAAETANDGAKKMLLSIAKHWETLAQELERTKKLLDDETGAMHLRRIRRQKAPKSKRRRRRTPRVTRVKRSNDVSGWWLN